MLPNFRLNSKLETTRQFQNFGIQDFHSAISFIEDLPYTPNSQEDYTLVLKELCGTGRTKNASLVQLAHENGFTDIKLALGFYNLNKEVFLQIDTLLRTHKLEAFPEAANYIIYNEERYDASGINNAIKLPLAEMQSEMLILPNQIKDFINHFHRFYIINWLRERSLTSNFTVDTMWDLRDKCKEEILRKINLKVAHFNLTNVLAKAN